MSTRDMPDRSHATTGRVSDDGADQEEMREQDERIVGKDFIKDGRLEQVEESVIKVKYCWTLNCQPAPLLIITPSKIEL